ncbi:MAG: energy-coupling factor transporter transmembrane protein EcfT [Clostridia bacterium]|nr:energy-coupling factor transporter transmembrane protein EcfT [Clostridia bacterium]
MNEFKGYHPAVNFIYFVAVIGFSMVFMHPVCLGISLACGFTYSVMLKGAHTAKTSLLYMLPLMAATALLNPAFNHAGVTVLAYLPSGNPLTLESIIYGLCAAVMLVSVICWFSCYNHIMTSDKFIYLFGRIIPSLSLILSMTLRFVPRFAQQLKTVTMAQKCIGRDVSQGSFIRRGKNALSVLSVMTTWALESSIDTADSMKARGYGLPGRSAFSIFSFEKRDGILLSLICALCVYIIAGGITGRMYFACFPAIEYSKNSFYGLSVFGAYAILCILPVIIEIREVIKWNSLKQKL